MRNLKVSALVLTLVMTASACHGIEKQVTPSGTLLFKSGFEGTTHIVPDEKSCVNGNPQKEHIVGSDNPNAPSDWKKDIENSPYFSGSLLNYEQGDYSQRRAEIVPDPADPKSGNKVLRFRINDEHIILNHGKGNLEHKARIQLELFNRRGAPPDGYLKEYYQTCRVYFSPEFKVLEDVPPDTYMGWFVMQEFWDDPNWYAPGRTFNSEARTGVEITRSPGKTSEKLRFGAGGRFPVMAHPFNWLVTDNDFEIPLGKWMTQEIYVKEGDSKTGRFYMAVTVDGVKTVLVDRIGITTSDAPGYVPDGQTSWTPFKVYTQGVVAKWFKAKGANMDVCWDDLEIWKDRRP